VVILSNAADDQVMSNVEKLSAPFDAVFTAGQAQAYKPRFKAFHYMFNLLGCSPQDVLHHMSGRARTNAVPSRYSGRP
jgi:2-haloacid dehalogenase